MSYREVVRINKWGKVSIKALFLGVLLFGAVITGLSEFATEIGGNYNRTTSILPSFDKSGEINTTMTNFMSAISEGDIFVAAMAFLLMPAALIGMMLSSWGYMSAMISESLALGSGVIIPSWFVSLLMTGSLIVVLFALWNAITGRRET